MITLWRRWVATCSASEDALSLSLVRVLMMAVVLWDLGRVGLLGLPPLLWAPQEAGGTVQLARLTDAWTVLHAFDAARVADWGVPVAWVLFAIVVASGVSFGLGVFTRFSGLLFVISYAQTQILNDDSDRGIDRMVRIVALVLVFSGSHRRLSFDAWRRTGSWWGDSTPVLAWPRYFLVFQLTVMYLVAGMEKFAFTWFPWGGSTALYLILQDPLLATMDYGWLRASWALPFTQVGTSVSHAWEWMFWLVPLAMWFQATRDRPGRLRATFNAWDVRWMFIIVGVIFHASLAATLRLGIFPAAMLSLYPIFFYPDEILAFVRRWRGATRWGGGSPDVR